MYKMVLVTHAILSTSASAESVNCERAGEGNAPDRAVDGGNAQRVPFRSYPAPDLGGIGVSTVNRRAMEDEVLTVAFPYILPFDLVWMKRKTSEGIICGT